MTTHNNVSSTNHFSALNMTRCPCGELGLCSSKGAACNCDGTGVATDFGVIREKAVLPMKCFGDASAPSGSTFPATSIGYLECGKTEFGLEKTCQQYVYRGFSQDYAYRIDRDGGTSEFSLSTHS